MKKRRSLISTLSGILLAVFIVTTSTQCTCKKEKILSFTILQLNDVYEIAPLAGTDEGGMARVATIRNELLKKDPNTITMLAGDFVSPSYIGVLMYEDSASGIKQRINGKQMIETMNAVGMDYVTFGNHEFDIPISQLQKRIDESKFTWVSSNVLQRSRNGVHPFIKHTAAGNDTIMPYAIRNFSFEPNEKMKLGIIGVTLPFNKADSIEYLDMYASVEKTYTILRKQCDVVIALTHLDFKMDSLLATKVPGLDFIVGGHEHHHNLQVIGKVPISKADANAKSVYIHTVTFNTATRKTEVTSRLSFIDNKVATDSTVNKTVRKWINFAHAAVRNMGYDPDRKIMNVQVPLDGRESEVRNHPTNYTQLVADALLWAEPSCDLALYNSGALRLDDQLSGEITEYDILRSFPFGGSFVLVSMRGKDLKKILTIGLVENKGAGGYLQLGNTSMQNGNFYAKGKLVSDEKLYKILMPEFVARGKESNLDFISQFKAVKPTNFRGNINNEFANILIAYMTRDK